MKTLPELGQEFQGFIIEKELPRGGQARVYRAWQTQLGRSVALKLLPSGFSTDEDALKRFTAEIAAVAKLSHPNIVQVYEAGELDSHPYFTMEYLDGHDCETLIEDEPLGPDEAASLIEQIARAAHDAHRNGIVHRDIKPGNIITRADGTPVLTDFGLAQDLLHSAQLTQTGVSMGTPAYMSPEQARGERNRIGVKSDIYALGATTYTLLTGKRPVAGESAYEIMVKVAENQGPKWTRTEQEDIPADLRAIVEMAMANDASKRYDNADAFADDLERFLKGEWVVARSRNKFVKSLIRARRYSSVAAVVVLSLGLAGSLIYTGLAVNPASNGQGQVFGKTKDLSDIDPEVSEEEFQKTIFGDKGSWTKSGATASLGVDKSLLFTRDLATEPIQVSPKDPVCWGDFELQLDIFVIGLDGELTLLFGMPETHNFAETAYAIQLGSEARNRVALYRLGVPVAAITLEKPILEGAWYSAKVQRTGMTIDFQLRDAPGNLLAEISYDDAFPALASPRLRFGIEASAAQLALRNVTAGHRDNRHPEVLLLFSVGQYEEAALRLTALLAEPLPLNATNEQKSSRAENLYLRARCRFQQQAWASAAIDCRDAKLLTTRADLRSQAFLLGSQIETKLENDASAIAQLRAAPTKAAYFDALSRGLELEALQPERSLVYYQYVSANALGQPWLTCESLQRSASLRLQSIPSDDPLADVANYERAIEELSRASATNYAAFGRPFSDAAAALFAELADDNLSELEPIADRISAAVGGYKLKTDKLAPCLTRAMWMARIEDTFFERQTDERLNRWMFALQRLENDANTELQRLMLNTERQTDAVELLADWRKLGEGLDLEDPQQLLASAVSDFFIDGYTDRADLIRRRNKLLSDIRSAKPESHWIADASPSAFTDYCVAMLVSQRNPEQALTWLKAVTSSPDAGIFKGLIGREKTWFGAE
ncbi:MAG: serine/threonine protein kinase [Planctomycetes bacterium]|nr:serine/threonine protein kinase [Planctomycetota bacterium]